MNNNALRDPRQYVAQWMHSSGVAVNASGSLKSAYGIPTSMSTMMLDHHEHIKVANQNTVKEHLASGSQGAPKLLKPLSKTLLEYAWTDYPLKHQEQARKDLIARVVPYKGPNNEIAKWITAVTGQASELDIAVMKHFMWQVKRKMLDLPVVYHICPIFFGKQNGGKTTSIQRLLDIAKDVVLELGPDEATDPRARSGFSNNYICFFDEMANMARVEMESLKRLITNNKLSYRPMHTNRIETAEQNCSFIGASNKSLQEVVFDPTGLRRFYELTCLDRADFDGINSVDYDAVWGSVDPASERGYTEPFLDQMSMHQSDRLTEDEVTHFVRELAINEQGPKKEIAARALYDAYINWRAQSGYSAKQALVSSTFGARLSTHRINKRVRKVDGYQRTVYDINASSKAFDNQLTVIKGGTA